MLRFQRSSRAPQPRWGHLPALLHNPKTKRTNEKSMHVYQFSNFRPCHTTHTPIFQIFKFSRRKQKMPDFAREPTVTTESVGFSSGESKARVVRKVCPTSRSPLALLGYGTGRRPSAPTIWNHLYVGYPCHFRYSARNDAATTTIHFRINTNFHPRINLESHSRINMARVIPVPRLLLLLFASALPPPPALDESRLLCGTPMAFAAWPICSISCLAEACVVPSQAKPIRKRRERDDEVP